MKEHNKMLGVLISVSYFLGLGVQANKEIARIFKFKDVRVHSPIT